MSIQAPEGSDLAAAAAAEQDAITRADLAIEAREAAYQDYCRAQDAYDAAVDAQLEAVDAQLAARKAHVAAMRAAGLAQTADGYVPR